MRTVGIDIGTFSIKVAEMEGQSTSPILRDFREFPLNHDPGQDLRLDKIEVLRQIVPYYDPSLFKIVVGIGSEYSTSRALVFPFLERRKILQSLPFELEDVIPFSQSDAIFDFRTIYQRGSSTKVFAVASPKRYIQDLLHLCDDAGLSPDVICPDGIALANHFEDFSQPPRQVDPEGTIISGPAHISIHIGYTKTLVDVFQDRSLVASRAIYFGGRDLTNTVSRVYQLPFHEALKGVSEKGFILTSPQGANEDQIAFSQTIEQSLNILVADLQRTILDLKAELQTEFETGAILGGMSRLINLGPYLTQRTGIPFTVHSHLGKTTYSDVQASESSDKASAIAVGLAIEGMRKPKNPAVNLRKNEFSKQSQNLEAIINRYKKVLQMTAIVFVAFLAYSWLRSSFTEDNLTALEKAVRDQGKNPVLNLTTIQLKPESLKKFVKAKKEEIESKKAVMRLNKMTSALDIIKNISTIVPGKERVTLDIGHFDLEGERLILQGTVNSKSELDLLQKSLSQMHAVSGVNVNSKDVGRGKMAFAMTLNIARLPATQGKGTNHGSP